MERKIDKIAFTRKTTMNLFSSGLQAFFLFLFCFTATLCEEHQRTHWYIQYGPVNHGRVGGTFQGSLSKLQCSRLCSDLPLCISFQVSRENGKLTCHTFPRYSHSRKMVPSVDTYYYEKIKCGPSDLVESTAALYFKDWEKLYVFSRTTVYKLFYKEENDILYGGPHHNYVVSDMFPDVTTVVDGATQYYGNNVMLISGSSVACFSRDSETFTSVSCPANIIQDYFSYSGFSDLDGITHVDDTLQELNVFKNDVVYVLTYNETEARYFITGSKPLTEENVRWSQAPFGVTAVTMFGNSSYLMFENSKMYYYASKLSYGILLIKYWCK